MASRAKASRKQKKTAKEHLEQDYSAPETIPTETIPKKGLHLMHLSQLVPIETKSNESPDVKVDHMDKISFLGVISPAGNEIIKKLVKVPIVHRWKMTKRVGYQVIRSEQLNLSVFLTLVRKTRFEALQTLYLIFAYCTISTKDIQILLNSLPRDLPELTHLDLHFRSCVMTSECVAALKSHHYFPYYKFQKLNIHFSDCNNLGDKCLTAFPICPAEVNNIGLRFTRCHDAAINIESLGFESSGNSKQLQRLSITPYFNVNLAEKRFLHSLPAHLKSRFLELQKLDIVANYQSGTFVNEESLIALGSEISQNFKNLQQLTISLSGTMFGLSTASYKPLTDKGLEVFATSLTQLSKLKKLSLEINWQFDASNKGLNLLGTQICQHLPNLECLALSFNSWKKINGTAAKKFVNDICKNLTHLNYLSVNFTNCSELYPEDLKAIKNKISNFMSKAKKEK